jgi:hypothetical protein
LHEVHSPMSITVGCFVPQDLHSWTRLVCDCIPIHCATLIICDLCISSGRRKQLRFTIFIAAVRVAQSDYQKRVINGVELSGPSYLHPLLRQLTRSRGRRRCDRQHNHVVSDIDLSAQIIRCTLISAGFVGPEARG